MSERRGARTTLIDAENAGRRLDNYLISVLDNIPKTLIYKIIRTGEVRVNGGRPKPGQRLEAGDRIRLPPLRIDAAQDPIISAARLRRLAAEVLFETDRVLVLNKPSGWAVHAGTGLKYGVIDAVRVLRPGAPELVHRLDRDTSGCLLIAKDARALRDLQRQLREGTVEKRYTTLLRGRLGSDPRRVAVALGAGRDARGERRSRAGTTGRPAETHLEPVETFGLATLTRVILITGRTHQIRAHAEHIGHPVAGDRRYGDGEFNASMRSYGLGRLFLHAHCVGFRLPDSAQQIYVEAPLPSVLADVLTRLRCR